MKLVIVESPTKAKTISKFLGKGFMVESSFGHMRDLPRSKLGIDEENNFEPQYVIPTRARKNVNALKKKAALADEVILATDEDREGEAIAWHLVQALELNAGKAQNTDHGTQRIVFHEITKSAIEEALRHPRDIDMDLVNAQQARRVLDRLVGYKLSPFLWKKVARGLSAGRVQSVAVRLIVEREEERKKFEKQEYWTIGAEFSSADKKSGGALWEAKLIKIREETLDKFAIKDQAHAERIARDLEKSKAIISSIELRTERKRPLPPFTTSTLQQTAGRWFGFSAKQTMALAQRLYEKGFITYMRTDSLNISQETLAKTKTFIEKAYGAPYAVAAPRTFKTKSKSAQEAHEAIRPTDPSASPSSLSIDEREQKLYELIWQRFMGSQFPEAEINATRVDIQADDYTLRATGTQLVFDGFLKVYPAKVSENILPKLKEKEALTIEKIKPEQHFTEPPPRYNEASLIKTLEQFGIGRPSTYAPTISTIQDRGYIEKDEQKRLYPTETADIVNGMLVKHFPEIVDIQFTARIETEFDEIAAGKKEWVPVIKEFHDPFAKHLEEKYESVESQKFEEKVDDKCSNCGKDMVIKRGRFGKFIACTGFPDCKTTKKLPEKALGKCPTCKEGDVVRRKSKKGRFFFGCSRWPDCDFVAWKLPENNKDATVKE